MPLHPHLRRIVRGPNLSTIRVDTGQIKDCTSDGRLKLHLPAFRLTSIDARESRIPALTKAVLDAGRFSSQLAMDLSRQRDTAFNFASRLEKLEDTVAKLQKPAA
jgi:hypothetical protein